MSPVPSWLKKDARNRAFRALLQAIVATILIPAGDAAVQVVQRALIDSMAGQPLNWQHVGISALYSAGVGITISVLSYIHRAKIDQTMIPSAPPPQPSRWPTA